MSEEEKPIVSEKPFIYSEFVLWILLIGGIGTYPLYIDYNNGLPIKNVLLLNISLVLGSLFCLVLPVLVFYLYQEKRTPLVMLVESKSKLRKVFVAIICSAIFGFLGYQLEVDMLWGTTVSSTALAFLAFIRPILVRSGLLANKETE